MGTVEEVTLSEDIRNWVLIPLTLASILMDILTQLVQRVSPRRRRFGKPPLTRQGRAF